MKKIPRRLKELISKQKAGLTIEQEKSSFALVRQDGERMFVDMGQVVTLDQWNELGTKISKFAKLAQ